MRILKRLRVWVWLRVDEGSLFNIILYYKAEYSSEKFIRTYLIKIPMTNNCYRVRCFWPVKVIGPRLCGGLFFVVGSEPQDVWFRMAQLSEQLARCHQWFAAVYWTTPSAYICYNNPVLPPDGLPPPSLPGTALSCGLFTLPARLHAPDFVIDAVNSRFNISQQPKLLLRFVMCEMVAWIFYQWPVQRK